jgi:hypothetical protein
MRFFHAPELSFFFYAKKHALLIWLFSKRLYREEYSCDVVQYLIMLIMIHKDNVLIGEHHVRS